MAMSILMGILYCARMARFDLLRITCKLATRVTKWMEKGDARILQLVKYIHSTYDQTVVGLIGDDVTEINLRVFTDADFGGDVVTQRSTTGVHLALHGRFATYPLQGVSKRQGANSFSTPEAELIAEGHGLFKVMIPALDLWETIAPSLRSPLHHEDNQAMIMVIMSGRNPTMRHLAKTHRVDVHGMHEQLWGHKSRSGVLFF